MLIVPITSGIRCQHFQTRTSVCKISSVILIRRGKQILALGQMVARANGGYWGNQNFIQTYNRETVVNGVGPSFYYINQHCLQLGQA